jgi:poly(3-hydroxybutyrate) depolymerase
MGRRLMAAAVWGAVLLPAQTGPAPLRTGPQLATYRSDLDGSNQQYALYVPRSFDAAKKYPLVISLHAEESNHRINLRRVLGVSSRLGEPDIQDMRYFPPVADIDYIVASPFARGTMGYQGIAEKDVYDVLADVERRFPIDRDRVYLTGISMGGAGAIWLAATRPDVWAAVAPLCPVRMSAAEPFIPNALNLPIRLFQGEQDPIVSPGISREWQRKFMNAGVAADYVEYPDVRHDVWDLAYRGGTTFQWFGKARRNLSPDHVRFVTQSYRYSEAYWVRLDGLTPGTAASIDARRTGRNAIAVETRELEGFSLVGQSFTTPVTVTIDGAALRVKPAATLSFRKVAGQWRAGLAAATGKHAGAEGPISEAVSSRQVYVYGTMGGGPDEQEARRRVAESAANWSTLRTRVAVSFPVKADSAVTAEDLEDSDLILFGTAETNSLVARFAPQLPLSLNPGAADYGLLFIAPLGKHYVLVSSGLPWWTGAEEVQRGGDLFAPPRYRLLSTFGDYILFKGSLADVVGEGRFDRNWKVPADVSAKLQATGTVTVH